MQCSKMSAPMHRKLLSVLHFLFVFTFVCLISNVIDVFAKDLHEFLLCRKCGREMVELVDLINIPSDDSLKRRNITIGRKKKVLVQLFKNPQGMHFDVITAMKADTYTQSEASNVRTWWSGYNWNIIGCPQCMKQLGWRYEAKDPTDKSKFSFVGLILDNLVFENDADNLLVIPKSYRS